MEPTVTPIVTTTVAAATVVATDYAGILAPLESIREIGELLALAGAVMTLGIGVVVGWLAGR